MRTLGAPLVGSQSTWQDGQKTPARYRCFCDDSHWQPSWLRPAGFGHALSRVTRRDAGSAPTSADSRRTPSGTSWWKFEVLLQDCSGTPTGLVDRKITSERHRPQRAVHLHVTEEEIHCTTRSRDGAEDSERFALPAVARRETKCRSAPVPL